MSAADPAQEGKELAQKQIYELALLNYIPQRLDLTDNGGIAITFQTAEQVTAFKAKSFVSGENSGRLEESDNPLVVKITPQGKDDLDKALNTKLDALLIEAAQAGYVEAAESLINDGANVNAKDHTYGNTALHLAAMRQNAGMSKMLINKGADQRIENNEGFWAEDLPDSIFTEPSTSVAQGSANQLPNPIIADTQSQYENLPAMEPLYGNTGINLDILRRKQLYSLALGNGCTPENIEIARNGTLTIKLGSAEAAQEFLTTNQFLDTKAIISVTNPVEIVIDQAGALALDAHIKAKKSDLFVRSVAAGYIEVATKLLEDGANINAPDANGNTALHLAAANDDLETTKFLLLKPEIDTLLTNHDRKTATDLAQGGQKELIISNINAITTQDREDVAAMLEGLEDPKSTLQTPIAKSKKTDDTVKKSLFLLALDASGIDNNKIVLQNETIQITCTDAAQALAISKNRIIHGMAIPNSDVVTIHDDGIAELYEHISSNREMLLVRAMSQTIPNTAAAKELLDKPGLNMGYKDSQGITVLQAATKLNDLALVRTILTKYPDIGSEDAIAALAFAGDHDIKDLLAGHISTKLTKAVEEKNSEEVGRILTAMKNHPLELSSIINSPLTNGSNGTLLHHAVRENLHDIAIALIDHGANIQAKNKLFETPLSIVNDKGSPAIKDAFRKREELLSRGLLESLKSSAATDRDNTVARYLAQGANPNFVDPHAKGHEAGYTAMHYAAKLGNADISKALIAMGGDPTIQSANFESPVHIAARLNHGEVIGSFGDKANLSQKDNLGRTALDIVTAFNKPESISAIGKTSDALNDMLHQCALDGKDPKDLLSRGANPNAIDLGFLGDKRPIHYASEAGHLRIVQELIKAGADPMLKDSDGNTVLHRTQDVETVSAVFESLSAEKRAELCKSKDDLGSTPLHYASSPEQAELLLANGADIHAKDNNNNNTLFIAAESRRYDLVKKLLQKGADPQEIQTLADKHTKEDLRDIIVAHRAANTALLLGAESGDHTKVKAALDAGAYIGTMQDGKTAIHLAAENPHANAKAVMELLVKAPGAPINSILEGTTETALHLAAGSGNVGAVAALIGAGADPLARDSNRKTAYNISIDISIDEKKKAAEAQQKFIHAKEKAETRRLESSDSKNKQEPAKAAFDEATAKAKAASEIAEALTNPTNEAKLLAAAKAGDKGKALKYAGRLGTSLSDKTLTQALFSAASAGHVDTLNGLLDVRRDAINLANEAGDSLMHAAVKARKLDVVKALSARALINHTSIDSKHSTALHNAIDSDNPSKDIIAALVSATNAPLNTIDNDGHTAAHLAVMRGNLDALKALADNKADLTLKDSQGRTPMHLAAELGQKEALAFLLAKSTESVKELDVNNRTPLHLAAASSERDSAEMIEMITKAGGDVRTPDKFGQTPVQLAAASNHPKAIAALVERGADDPKTGHSIIDDQIMAGNIEEATRLYNRTFNTTVEPDFLLYAASSNKTDVVARLVTGKYPKLDGASKSGMTALHYAAAHGNDRMLGMLADKVPDMNALDTSGCSPLDYAIENRHVAAVQFLHGKNATRSETIPDKDITSPEIRVALDLPPLVTIPVAAAPAPAPTVPLRSIDSLGEAEKTATLKLHRMLSSNRDNTAEIHGIVTEGADVNAVDSSGRTALHLHLDRQAHLLTKEVVELLITPENINALDNQGQSPLCLAAQMADKPEIFSLLIERRADRTFTLEKDGQRLNLLELAIIRGNIKAAQSLLNHGLVSNMPNLESLVGNNHDNTKAWIAENKAKISAQAKGAGVAPLPLGAGLATTKEEKAALNSLCHAAAAGNIAEVTSLLDRGVHINGQDQQFEATPLHYAVFNAQKDVVDLLVGINPDLNIIDNQGYTVLDRAISRGYVDIAKALKEAGAKISQEPDRLLEGLHPDVQVKMRQCMDPELSARTLQILPHTHSPTLIRGELSREFNERVDKFLNKGCECWGKAENDIFTIDIRKESADLAHDLTKAGRLHDDKAVYKPIQNDGTRKIYEIKLDQLKGKRIFMPKFNEDGSNMMVGGKQVMDILEIGPDGTVAGGTITPPPERSSISQNLIEDLKQLQAPSLVRSVAPVAAAPALPKVSSPKHPRDDGSGPMIPANAAAAALIRQFGQPPHKKGSSGAVMASAVESLAAAASSKTPAGSNQPVTPPRRHSWSAPRSNPEV